MFLLKGSSDICMIRLDFVDGTISEPAGIISPIVLVFDQIILSIFSLGKPSFKKNLFCEKVSKNGGPPPPRRGFMKAYFFWGYILGPLHCIVKKIEV